MQIYGSEKTKGFDMCIYNNELAPDFREICLWENISEYNHPKFRENQWAFKKDMRLAEACFEIKNTDFLEKKRFKKTNDPEIEMLTGSFSHGGDFLVKHYFNKKKKPVVRSKAQICVE